MSNKYLEESIRAVLHQEAKKAQTQEMAYNRVREAIYKEECKMKENRRSNKGMKKGLIVVGILAIASMTVVGVGKAASWTGHSTNNTFMSYPTEEAVEKKVGFVPKYVETLPGGYTFSRGGIGETSLEDDRGGVLVTGKGVTFLYEKKGENSSIGLDAKQLPAHVVSYEGAWEVERVGEIALYYNEQQYKFVPEDYVLTTEDHAAIEDGSLAVSVGTREIEENLAQGIQWYEDGILYHLLGFDTGLAEEDFVEMAKVILADN